MKTNSLIRRIAVFLLCMAITLSYIPASFCVYAQDGAEEAAEPDKKTEQVSEEKKEEASKPKTEEKAKAASSEKVAEPEKTSEPEKAAEPEKSAEPEAKEEAKAEEKSSAEPSQAQAIEEKSEAASEADAPKNEAEDAQAAEETPAPVKPAPAKNISVKYHFYQKDASGNYVEARTISRSVSAGKSTTAISKSTANGYVTNKKIEGENNMVTEFAQVWKDASGSETEFPLSMSYEKAADLTEDGSTVDVRLYAQYSTHKASAKITLRFEGIRHADGRVTSAETSNSIGWGNGWSMTKKKFESTTGITSGQSFSCNGYRYTYTGQWKDQSGNIIDSASSISFKVKDGETTGNSYFITDDITLTFTPVYDETMVQGLDCFFIDNISTGSGSWSNKGALYRSEFSSYRHTFRDPSVATPVEHFRFLYWEKEAEAVRGAGERFYDGDTYSFAVDSGLPEGTVTTVKVYAYWQPSVTVNYYVNGELAESRESFDEEIAAYGYEPEQIEGVNFTGWYTGSEDADRVAEGTAYGAPAITREAVEQKVINLYAGFEEIRKDEPAAVQPKDPKAPKETPETKNSKKPAAGRKTADTQVIAETTIIAEESVPAAAPAADMINIEEAETPLAEGTWALVNLIAAIMTALGAVIALFRRKEEEDDEDNMYKEEDEDDNRGRKMLAAKIAGALAGVAAPITFFLTEDMSLPMAMIDKWTVLMVIMLAVQILAAALVKKASELEDDEEMAEEAAN